jgi:HlyD family secretion protein
VKKSRIITISSIILAVLIIGSIIKSKVSPSKNADVVRLEQAQRGQLVEFVSAPGEIEPKKKVDISAKVSARIIELPYKEGDVVTKGDPDATPPVPPSVLVKLDDEDLQSQLRSTQASKDALAAQVEVDKARISSQQAALLGLADSLEQAEKDLERKKGLIETKDISQSVFDLAQVKADEYKAQYEAAKHTLEAAKLNLTVLNYNIEAADARIAQAKEALTYTTITSPIDGVLTLINAEVGEVVIFGTMNNPGTVILQVADLSKMLVVAQVDEADIGNLKVTQQAKVHVQAFPDIEFTGLVDTIALTHRFSQNQTKYFRTEILLDNDPNVAKLYSGLTADVDIQTIHHENILKVPSQAVLAREIDILPLDIRENNPNVNLNKIHATVVYRFINGKAVVTPVKIGPSDLTHTIITSGLTEEDKIVVGPYKVLDTLKHDQKLQDERTIEKDNDVNKAGGNKTASRIRNMIRE